jgi:hypothetical protein
MRAAQVTKKPRKPEELRLVTTGPVGTGRPACPVDRVEITPRFLLKRFNLCFAKAHRIAEMRSSQRLRSAVPQLTIDPAYSVAAFHEGLINNLRLITRGTDARGCYGTGRHRRRGSAGLRDDRRVRRYCECRWSDGGNVITRSTRYCETGNADECDDSHSSRMVAPSHPLSECFQLVLIAVGKNRESRFCRRVPAP